MFKKVYGIKGDKRDIFDSMIHYDFYERVRKRRNATIRSAKSYKAIFPESPKTEREFAKGVQLDKVTVTDDGVILEESFVDEIYERRLIFPFTLDDLYNTLIDLEDEAYGLA